MTDKEITKILNYINIGRGNIDEEGNIKKPLYTKDDIHFGVPNKEFLCWGITNDGKVVPNMAYYLDKKEWWIGYVFHGMVREKHYIGDNIVAFVKYDKKQLCQKKKQ